jgi:hypothetical protein
MRTHILGAGLSRMQHPSIGDDCVGEAVIDSGYRLDKAIRVVEPARGKHSVRHGGKSRKLEPEAERLLRDRRRTGLAAREHAEFHRCLIVGILKQA